MKHGALFMAIGMLSAWLSIEAPAHAMTVTQLEVTRGAINYDGKYGEMIDRLLAQDGTLKLGQFQAIGDLVPSIEGCKTYSLFTSGFNGAEAPSAVISGSSIKVDLSSLFFSAAKGNSSHLWNIGEVVTGLFNPDTKEFALSWDRVFDGDKHKGQATFFLSGLVHFDTQPVAIPASMLLYATGLFGLGSWAWWRRQVGLPVAA
ncbi:MAG: hypothetical protein QM706_12580 [Nitrospira sp.]